MTTLAEIDPRSAGFVLGVLILTFIAGVIAASIWLECSEWDNE